MMANAIQIKRRSSSGPTGAPSASVLKWGELAFNEADNTLYYGYGSGDNQALSVPSIGGSGAYSLRGGTNASGTWPISVTGNAATSNQVKTQQTSTNSSHYLTFVDSDNGSATAETIYTDAGLSYNPSTNTLSAGIIATTGSVTVGGDLIVQGTTTTVNSTEVDIGDNIITVNASGLATGGFRVKDATGNYQSLIWNETNSQWEFQGDTANIYTSGELTISAPSTTSIGWIPVFDGGDSPDNSPTVISYITRSNFLSDLGIASSGTQVIAGNGLTGGGTLETDITLDVGQGDGISVTANAVAVDSTVVRTTGNQNIIGNKDFYGSDNVFHSGISFNGLNSTNSIGWVAVFDGAGSPDSTESLLSFITRDDFLADIGIASQGVTLTAGNGLTGGGDLTADRTFDVNTGYGLDISGDAVVVDTTEVVVTTGNQNIAGIKTFSNSTIFNNGVIVSGGQIDLYTPDIGVAFRVTEAGAITSGIWSASTISVDKGGTGQTSYTNGQLLIGNNTGNTLTKATLTSGNAIDITNGPGSITISHAVSTLLPGQHGTNGIANITTDIHGHITNISEASFVTISSLCGAIAGCPIDGGTF